MKRIQLSTKAWLTMAVTGCVLLSTGVCEMAAETVNTTGSVSKTESIAPKSLDITRNVPLNISGYKSAKSFPSKFTSPDQVMAILNGKRNLLIHMEALRRGYHDLSFDQQTELLEKLMGRYQALSEDPVRFFDHGYAQILYNKNKTGLFFLRKANDRIKDQFSSLAYAMAQAEVDYEIEGSPADELSTRKINVSLLIKDAINRDVETPRKGFWPSVVKVIDSLRPLSAYGDVTRPDFSSRYLPYGSSSFPIADPTEVTNRAKPDDIVNVCCAPGSVTLPDKSKLFRERHGDINNDGSSEIMRFYTTDEDDVYRVITLNKDNQVIGDFLSHEAPYIVEDLDDDKVYEFVIRQYKFDPLNPVKVYRYDGCSYKADSEVSDLFH